MALHYPMAMNLHKGHQVAKDKSKPRHSPHCGRLTECTKFLQDII